MPNYSVPPDLYSRELYWKRHQNNRLIKPRRLECALFQQPYKTFYANAQQLDYIQYIRPDDRPKWCQQQEKMAAAGAAAMRTALQRLGFSPAASASIVTDQAIESVDELSTLTDKEVENLCKVVRRPGGQVPDPNHAGAGAAPLVNNPGTPVSLQAENNLKLAAYWLRYRNKASQVTTPVDITKDAVRGIRALRDWEDNHTDPDPPDGLVNEKDWPKTMDTLDEFLRNNLGVTGIPLLYVVRKDVEPTVEPAGGFPSLQDEMIERAPIQDANGISTPTFTTDNHRVFELLASLTRDKDCWTYVRPSQRTRNGRLAYMALYDHYLGPNNLDHMASQAEGKLKSTRYYGEKKRWNFEKFARVHVEQHTILEGLALHGHAGIDERSKVRHLLDGIMTKDMDSVKTQVMADATLRGDFTRVVTLCQDYLKASQNSETRQANISAVATGNGGNKGGGDKKPTGKKTGVEDKYYTTAEYRALGWKAQRELKKLRAERGHTPKKRKAEDKTLDRASIKAIVAKEVRKSGKKGADDTASASSATSTNDSSEDDAQDNRKHPALKRQRRAAKKK